MNITALLDFLSDFPFFENEKDLISHLDKFLTKEYKIKQLVVFSVHNEKMQIEVAKCRLISGKKEYSKTYDENILAEILKKTDLKNLPSLCHASGDYFYYYINLGFKKDQFYFGFFLSSDFLPTEALASLSLFSRSHLKMIHKVEELYKVQELIHIDDVTGLYNQRKLHKDLASLTTKFQKEKDPFCILFIDIDYFKKVNDMYGHLAGTKLLGNVASDIKLLLRDSDISYRYGGDEFVVLLVNSNASSGKIVGERILKLIKNHQYEINNKNEKKMLQLSVSIGVAEFPTDAINPEEILAIADRMMYEAKESGRGIVFNTQDVFKSSLQKIKESK